MYKPGDSYSKEFVASSPTTGAAANADSLPTATADFDGSGTGSMALTVTNLDTGRYKVTGTVPGTRVKGDVLNVSVAATVGGNAGKAVVDTQVIDSKRVGDLADAPALTDYQQRAVAVTLPTVPTDWLTAAGVKADAVTKIQAGLATPTNITAGTIGSVSGSVNSVATGVTVATNNDKTGYTLTATPPTAAQVRAEMDANSTKLANLTGPVALASQIPANFTTATFASAGVFSVGALANAPTGSGGGSGASLAAIQGELDARALTSATTALVTTNLDARVSTRSTYAGGDTSGTTTLLTRLPGNLTVTGGAVNLNLAQTGLTPRALDSVADSALTVGDGIVAAICGAAGKESVSGTAYLVKTPSTGTQIRGFTLDSSTAPTSRS